MTDTALLGLLTEGVPRSAAELGDLSDPITGGHTAEVRVRRALARLEPLCAALGWRLVETPGPRPRRGPRPMLYHLERTC